MEANEEKHCGSSFLIHTHTFDDCCKQHDELYEFGGNELDRKSADKTFLKCMKEKVKGRPLYLRPYYYGIAYSFYCLVRIFGKKHFTFKIPE